MHSNTAAARCSWIGQAGVSQNAAAEQASHEDFAATFWTKHDRIKASIRESHANSSEAPSGWRWMEIYRKIKRRTSSEIMNSSPSLIFSF